MNKTSLCIMNEPYKREKKELCTKENEIKVKRGNASGQVKMGGGGTRQWECSRVNASPGYFLIVLTIAWQKWKKLLWVCYSAALQDTTGKQQLGKCAAADVCKQCLQSGIKDSDNKGGQTLTMHLNVRQGVNCIIESSMM